MRRTILLILSLSLVAARPLPAGTFDKSSIAPEFGLDALTRRAAREHVGRELFSNPWATVTIGRMDVYPVFPYVESRMFQIVSDPRWNRLVFGESGRSLRAYDGRGLALGPLSEPRGLAVDERDRVYVADAGNDRVLVLQAVTNLGEIELQPLFEVRGLRGPHDVAVSDGGTPFVPGDDVLYVADTGRNRVVAFALEERGARETAALGELGSGPGRFAGPMAIAAGRTSAANTRDVYVADAHTQRIVRLRHDASGLQWLSEARHDADVVTSLETDQWGNLYAAAPNQGVVRKLNADLTPVAELRETLSRPRSFYVPFVTVRDHRAGTVTRVGQPNGLTVDQWTESSGMRLWKLGLELSGLAVVEGDAPAARFTLTDAAAMTIEIADAATGQTIARRSVGSLDAGTHTLALGREDLAAAARASAPLLRLTATSSYPGGPSAMAETRLGGGSVAARPTGPALLGHSPNPVMAATRIAFLLPDGGTAGVSFRLFDATGRQVRSFPRRFTAGRNEVVWDGTNDRGARVAPGVYYYRLRVGALELARSLVLVR